MSDSRMLIEQSPGNWVAECHVCGKSYTADQHDVFRFLRGPWPACCGQTIVFRVVDGDPPLAEPAD